MRQLASIRIIQLDMLGLIIDKGRTGKLAMGYCQSGPMDEVAYGVADELCGNLSSTAQVEFIGQLTFECSADTTLAVTGPQADLTINGQAAPLWQCVNVSRGSVVAITPDKLGTRHYVCIGEGIRSPHICGSQSTVLREKLGGLQGNGQPLKVGDIIDFSPSTKPVSATKTKLMQPNYSLTNPIDVVLGYQYAQFSGAILAAFFSSSYTVTSQIDRMGYRLNGPKVNASVSAMYSEGIAFGAIQCPPDGQPIVMMADRQTLGGYPKIGCVARYDLPRFAQAVPGDTVTFRQISIENAHANYHVSRMTHRVIL